MTAAEQVMRMENAAARIHREMQPAPIPPRPSIHGAQYTILVCDCTRSCGSYRCENCLTFPSHPIAVEPTAGSALAFALSKREEADDASR